MGTGMGTVRMWRGTTAAGRADDYAAYLLRSGMPGYRAAAGNRTAYFTRRDVPAGVEFCLITVWESLDAVRAFAGADYETAVFYPEDDDFLVERERTATHYEIFAAE